MSTNLLVYEILPEWALIYFVNTGVDKYRCNICDDEIEVTENKLELLNHLEDGHKEVLDFHKGNASANVDYRIEFLQISPKDDGKMPLILGEICAPPHDYALKAECEDFLLVPENKAAEDKQEYHRKRSWVWKYFEQLTKTIYRCNICTAVLSIKGSNSNNMNRHIRTRHLSIYTSETRKKSLEDKASDSVSSSKVVPMLDRTSSSTDSRKQRRSWVWSYFTLVSRTRAKCKICKRVISHGGNATGNMNRHLKILHNKRGEEHDWIWKVFDAGDDVYSCKICQYQFIKFADIDKCVRSILDHLKDEHNVVSGSQILTASTFQPC
ncbi:unnamed protein product [Leptosia nina]|uniref:BED-type domain-containing protein n=1 Tax=Leptosia nina TaxID=320188 RepID=A0AAV1J619_9NEOP